MAIPKIIHYCWFGRNPKPKLAVKCIKSWKKRCPDYEIIEWNEDNFDIPSCPLYVRQAYEAKKWAFVTDYVRLKIVYDEGGIYLDTDVELIKSLDALLEHDAYFGFEDGTNVNTGLGFGAVKGAPILHEMMLDYKDIPFIMEDGKLDLTPCPQRNTEVLKRHGLVQNDNRQLLERSVLILPSEYLCPLSTRSQRLVLTNNVMSIHWFSGTWLSEEDRSRQFAFIQQIRARDRIHRFIHIPNRFLRYVLGYERYEALKRLCKRQ